MVKLTVYVIPFVNNLSLYRKTAILIYLLIFLNSILSCNKSGPSENKKIILCPINYKFKELKLFLNSNINNRTSQNFWSWDYMNSNNPGPDSSGYDYYMNHSQQVFRFNNQETLPSLSIKTYKNMIVQFSATVIFDASNSNKQTISTLLNSLKTFDLLKDEKVKNILLEKRFYSTKKRHSLETLFLNVSKESGPYKSITYNAYFIK
jgi:hypothetical protein